MIGDLITITAENVEVWRRDLDVMALKSPAVKKMLREKLDEDGEPITQLDFVLNDNRYVVVLEEPEDLDVLIAVLETKLYVFDSKHGVVSFTNHTAVA
jgi:hypothetical protein